MAPGNGSTKFTVNFQDMGGWVRVTADGSPTNRDELPVYLSHALTEWFRQRAHLRLKCVVPITKNGDVVEMHAWFEQHLFPDTGELGSGG